MSTSRRRYLRIVNIFITLTVLALLATVYLTFARALIFVPGDREQFTATASAEVDLGNDESSIATTVLSQEFEVSDTFDIRAKESASKKAGGTVTIVNKYSRNQPLVRSTRLVTQDGKLFRIAESVNVPAGGTTKVFAEADYALVFAAAFARKALVVNVCLDLGCDFNHAVFVHAECY